MIPVLIVGIMMPKITRGIVAPSVLAASARV
ncbi:unannotated protein [freshwater metagenome]|uniref:Unannotated protein n=1 Tax=freshwater metagenome TaxID=449393 RepID=A0A6J6M3G9_9ZZZZ